MIAHQEHIRWWRGLKHHERKKLLATLGERVENDRVRMSVESAAQAIERGIEIDPLQISRFHRYARLIDE